MDSISITDLITDIDPVQLQASSVSSWYSEELQRVEDQTPEQMAWLYAQGWINYTTSTDEYGNLTGWLKRTVIKPKNVLDDLVKDYTDAYNEGRQINDQRYDELVSCYAAMLSNSENDLIELEAGDETYDGLIETIVGQISSDYTTAYNDMSGSLDTFGDSQRTAIATRFAARKSEAKSGLISRGLYNTTTWEMVEAGIDREEAVALAELEDRIFERQLSLKDRLYALKTSMRDRILAARDRLRSQIHSHDMTRISLRNNVLQLMYSFMERRSDSYPDLSMIGNIVAQLGAGASGSFTP